MIDTLARLWTSASDAAAPLLLDTSVKATAIVVAAYLAATLLRPASAAVRHRVWGIAFVGLLLLPVLSAILPAWPLPILPGAGNGPAAASAPSAQFQPVAPPPMEAEPSAASGDSSQTHHSSVDWGNLPPDSASEGADSQAPTTAGRTEQHDAALAAASAPPGRAIHRPSWQTSIVVVWLIGLAVALVPVAVGLLRNRALCQDARPVVDFEPQRLFSELCRDLRVSRPVRLLEAQESLVPMTWGVFRPTVLLPLTWRDWSPERQRIVLLHELAHVKRWDMAFQWLGRLACAVYWFHPLVWCSLRWLRAERESACDDCVLMAGQRPSEYAQHLLDLARDCRAVAAPAAVAMAQPTGLERRVRALLDQTRSHLPVSRTTGGLVLGCAAIVLVAAAMVVPASTSEPRAQAAAASAETPPGVIEALAQQPSVSLSGHTAAVCFVAFGANDRTLVSASRDGTVQVRSLRDAIVRTTFKAIQETPGAPPGRHELYAAALSGDARTLATAGSDRTIALWDLATAKKLRTVAGEEGAVLALAFSPDGKTLVSTGMDRVVWVWDVATGKPLHEGYRGNAFRNLSVAVSPDGETILSGCRGNSVKLWKARVKRYVASLPPDGGPLALACAADDQGLAVGVDHGHITLWTGTPEGEPRRRVLEGHNGDVTAVAFTPDGKILASSGLDGMIRLWDVATGQRLSRALAHAGGVRSLAVSADGRLLASGGEDQTVKLWDVARLVRVSPAKPAMPLIQEPARPLRPDRLESVATAKIKRLGGVFLAKGSAASWSPDATRLAFGKVPPENGIAILDLKAGRQSTLVDVGRDPAWSPKEEDVIAYARGRTGEEEIWVVKPSGDQPRRIAEGSSPAWSPDGKTLYLTSRDGTLDAMSWPAGGRTPASKTVARDVGTHAAVSPDGKQVACFGGDGFLNLLDCKSGKVSAVRTVPGGSESVPARKTSFAAWSPDGRQIACGRVNDGEHDLGLWILDPVDVPPMHVIRGAVSRPAWSPDGSKLAFELNLSSGNEIWMLEAPSLVPLRALHAAHHPRGRPTRLDLKAPFSPKGTLTPLDLHATQDRARALGAVANPLDELPGLPRGEQTLAGVKFKIGQRPIQLGNEYLPMAPDRVEGIPVHRAVGRLFVLHGNGVGDPYTGFPNRPSIAHYRPLPFRSSAIDGLPDGAIIGYYRVRYEDGSDQWIAFAEGEDVRDWCSWAPVQPTHGTVAWKTYNEVTADRAAARGRQAEPFALFAAGWQNPHPERKVATIDYVAAGTSAAPFCVAITVEEP